MTKVAETDTIELTTQFDGLPDRPTRSVKWLPDTGSDVDAIGPDILTVLGVRPSDLSTDSAEVVNASGGRLMSLGMFAATLHAGLHQHQTHIHVYEGLSYALLSRNSLRELGILPQGWPRSACHSLSTTSKPIPYNEVGKGEPTAEEIASTREDLISEFSDVFSDGPVPAMKGDPMDINLVDDVKPFSVNGARPIPFAFREQVKSQINDMVRDGIIEPVTEPCEWCHPIVIVDKKGTSEKRLTVDLTKLNSQVQRPTHPVRTPRDAISNVQQARFFTTLDARNGYWQVPLSESARPLTTFITPWGRFRFLRNPQGFVAAGDEFNRRTDQVFQDINQFAKVVDDCLAYDAAFCDHIGRVRQILQRARENGVTFSMKKFLFAREEVPFCGYYVGVEGWRMDPQKTAAIREFPTPTNRTDLRSLLGLVNQFSDFQGDIAKLTQPLRSLLKHGSEFSWHSDHDQAVAAIKDSLLQSPTLSYFQFGAPTRLETDASRTKGLGFVLLQLLDGNWRLIQCGSRFLSDTETRYAMIELEMLAIAWAMKKCRVYLAGIEFEVVTDHQPLIPILNKYTLDEIENPRLQRIRMKTQEFQFHAIWRKGKDHAIADALSRAPISEPTEEDVEIGDLPQLCRLSRVSQLQDEFAQPILPEPQADRLREVAAGDPDYQQLRETVTTGFPNEAKQLPSAVRPYWGIRHTLAVEEGIVLKGCQIVIPRALRRQVLSDLHASHQGQERTKRRARQVVYWPGISRDINNTVSSCPKCREYRPSQVNEPIMHEPEPTRPWQRASADIFTCCGENYLVYTDHLSGWPCIDCLGLSTTSSDVIRPLRRWFADVGVPQQIITDGGPQFSSTQFSAFCKRWQVDHEQSTPHYPQSNGKAEAAVKAMKRLVQKTTVNGNLDVDEFRKALLEWRNTPGECGQSPAQVLFDRPLQSFVFANHRSFSSKWQSSANEVDQKRTTHRQKTDNLYNRGARTLGPLSIGDFVVHSGRVYWRNRRFLRPIIPLLPLRQPDQPVTEQESLAPASESPASCGMDSHELNRGDADDREPSGGLRRSNRRRMPTTRFDISTTCTKSYE